MSYILSWVNRSNLVLSLSLSAAAALIISLVTVLFVSMQTNDRLREANVNACHGTNLLRGYALIRSAQAMGREIAPPRDTLAASLLSIRDCERTFDQGRIVLVPDTVTVEYLRALAEGRRIALLDGGRRIETIP